MVFVIVRIDSISTSNPWDGQKDLSLHEIGSLISKSQPQVAREEGQEPQLASAYVYFLVGKKLVFLKTLMAVGVLPKRFLSYHRSHDPSKTNANGRVIRDKPFGFIT